MGKVDNNPRRGSKQFWPRKRAKKIIPRLRNYSLGASSKPLACLGYKAGMTHLNVRDNNSNSKTKSQNITIPVTIIECPPIKPLSIRFYKKTTKGLKLISEVFTKKADKAIKLGKSGKIPVEGEFDQARLVAYSEPKKTGISKKKPELFEMAIGGKSPTEQSTTAQEILAKDSIQISEIFDEGQLVDSHSLTKGKGFQGPVKRFGVKIRQHKSEKTKRGPGNLGPWTPKRVPPGQVPQAGKMGYHLRTEYNKLLIKIAKPEEVNQKGGIKQYGELKNDCLLIKGSIAGAAKRPIILTAPQRTKTKPQSFEVVKISQESKQ